MLLAINIFILYEVFVWLEAFIPEIYTILAILTVAMVIYLINSRLDPTAKITWLVVITVLPVFGTLLYVYSLSDFGHRAMSKRWRVLTDMAENAISQNKQTAASLSQYNKSVYQMARYVNTTGCYPVYDDTEVTYFSSGEEKYKALLSELENAKHFIFLEYFIIDEGVMWGNVLDILARKAAEGVEVRVMYDGTCEFSVLPKGYPEKLKKLGIRCRVFASVLPFISTHYNFRDHRKIAVIDGHTAFNGGINLADEYINRRVRFGHWKDTAVMLKGDAVKSFTLMFLQMWHVEDNKQIEYRYLDYAPNPPEKATGYVMPYGDSPLDSERVGEQVYIDMLNRAVKYVHIMTPYLILDAELESALRYAALRGVDVRIILPGIPDKKVPFALAKTHYKSLLSAGVKIYEYTPGFVHAKVFVCDDDEAVVGTINLDYRSLYHHFECATYMYKTDCISDIEKDFEKTLSVCSVITNQKIKKIKWYTKLTGYILKAFSPLI